MKILLTSGGAKVPIDEVRSITNMSSGTFGTKIGIESLNQGHHVNFICSKDSKTPFKFTHNFNGDLRPESVVLMTNKLLWATKNISRYYEISYSTYSDYYTILKNSTQLYKSDVIILAAAIPDYDVVNKVMGKIRSKDNMKIDLTPFPKIINKVKNEWGYKGILVGFKLLVGSTEDELIAAAQRSVVENNCDFVVANDLHDLKQNNHKIMLVGKDWVTHHKKEEAVVAILDKIKELKG